MSLLPLYITINDDLVVIFTLRITQKPRRWCPIRVDMEESQRTLTQTYPRAGLPAI